MKQQRNFNDWIDAYMKWQAESESPDSYKKWMAIGIVSSCLQKKCYVPWEPTILHPNTYIILVGPSGEARKGNAMVPAQRLLRDLNVSLSSNQATLQAIILDMKDALTTYNQKGSVPVPHCSLCIFSKELTVLLGYQDKDMFANLCDWYDCDDTWKKRTVSRDIEEITGLCVTLIGATTPMSLQSCLPIDAIGGGFTSRVVYVFEKKSPRASSPWKQGKALPSEEDYKRLLADLRHIKQLGGEFKVNDEAGEVFTEWYERGDGSKKKIPDKRFSGYNSRRATHVAKLSMIMSASRNSDMIIEPQDVQRAITELNTVEKKMHHVFAGVGMNPYSTVMIDVLEFFKARYAETGERDIKPGELLSYFSDDLSSEALGNIVADLEAMGYMRIVSGPTKSHFRYVGDEK